MPHAELVKQSTAMAAAVGEAHSFATRIRAVPGLPAAAVVLLGSLDGVHAKISNANVAMGEVAHGLSDEPAAEEKKAGAVAGDGKGGKVTA